MPDQPILVVDNVRKQYTRGWLNKQVTFSLTADFTVNNAAIIGVMGANGAGKTTLFEMITGMTPPTAGQIFCAGQNIQQVKYQQRDRLAIHYHQSYQVRNVKRTKPNFMMQPAQSDYPIIHLFDEPQFNTQDGYIPFMLDFFRRLRAEGRLVFISIHPTERYQIDIIRRLCDEYLFVFAGHISRYAAWDAFIADDPVQQYLGDMLPAAL